jgi:hypothetical protein
MLPGPAAGLQRTIRFLYKDGTKAPGEGHSAYHEYLFKLNKIAATLFTPTARRIAAGRQQFLNDYFEELAAKCAGNDDNLQITGELTIHAAIHRFLYINQGHNPKKPEKS